MGYYRPIHYSLIQGKITVYNSCLPPRNTNSALKVFIFTLLISFSSEHFLLFFKPLIPISFQPSPSFSRPKHHFQPYLSLNLDSTSNQKPPNFYLPANSPLSLHKFILVLRLKSGSTVSIFSQQKHSLKSRFLSFLKKIRLRYERKGLTIQHPDVKSVLNRVKQFTDKVLPFSLLLCWFFRSFLKTEGWQSHSSIGKS
ncbi:uncharacterized protein [Gossypium hirsutum]|uniref:Uncharacterized protein n=1 Tax=Gossypium hirsutum TaxID=3635 RepID=A0ABM3BN79_GOSHI|nr:uncharacterized protein LOC107956978 [Gossypium hirsutum]